MSPAAIDLYLINFLIIVIRNLKRSFWCYHSRTRPIVVTIFMSTLSLFLGTLTAARAMHHYLLKHVMRASQTTFFDVTPVGRILNRFSHDIDEVDNDLPSTLRAWTACFFGV